jgi:hypothetical protein
MFISETKGRRQKRHIRGRSRVDDPLCRRTRGKLSASREVPLHLSTIDYQAAEQGRLPAFEHILDLVLRRQQFGFESVPACHSQNRHFARKIPQIQVC